MNKLTVRDVNLPVELDDLQKYILVGRERLVAVRAEIRAINKLSIAENVRLQKLQEAQDIAEAVLDAEIKIGELISALPTAPGTRTDLEPKDSAVHMSVSKREAIESAGMTVRTAQRYETLAAHPEAVQRAKDDARRTGEIVSRTAILNTIRQTAPDKPFVVNNTGDSEWYTAPEIIESARRVMGSIDLDPASSEIANQTVQAARYYTIETDGLAHEWTGTVWLNPPYSKSYAFCRKLLASEKVTQAIVLVNNCTETQWFNEIASVASAIVFPKGRVTFFRPDGTESSRPLQGQAIIYVGSNVDAFLAEFGKYGWACIPYKEDNCGSK